MNGKGRYFLDTNALVALGYGNDALRTMLEEADYLATSVICKIEFLQGIALDSAACSLFAALLNELEVVDLKHGDHLITSEIVRIRQQNKHIKLPDAIVMASANVRQAVLITNDKQIQNSNLALTMGF